MVLKQIQRRLPHITFEAAKSFYWSPVKQTVYFIAEDLKDERGVWALLHEAAHAKLDHKNYSTDLELLMLEVAAWDEACRLGQSLAYQINSDHIQDCLDTYRDWLHQRSTCPACGIVSLQESPNLYRCFNCSTTWQVSSSRFCRPYRLRQYDTKKLPHYPASPPTTFHISI